VGTENGAVCRIELDSPLIYLVLITQIDLLRLLYARILVPPAVLAELKHPVAPKPVQDWLLMRRIGWRS
jgi:predicted nucleic acid-binding protein